MCRILALRSDAPVESGPFLRSFAERCRLSKEFQGDGWGVSWREGGEWRSWRAITPIWDTELPTLPPSRLVLAHARSAFRNERVVVENNMPFVEEGLAFAFNGELRGVRLQAPGDTGAWRLFHLFRRFRAAAQGDGRAALGRLDQLVRGRTEYVRALNLVISDGEDVWVNSRYSEDPDYFTLWSAVVSRDGVRVGIVCSERLDGSVVPASAWRPTTNGVTETLEEVLPCSW